MDVFRASTSYDPLGALIDEHWVFRDQMKSFLAAVRKVERDPVAHQLEPGRAQAFVALLEEDFERRHCSREEQGLYPILQRHVDPEKGPLAGLLTEHRALHDERVALAKSVASVGEGSMSVGDFLRQAESVQQLLDDHMEKEDTMLLPLAREVLTVEDLAEVTQVFKRLEERLGPVRRDPALIKASIGPALTPFCPAGRAKKDMAERA